MPNAAGQFLGDRATVLPDNTNVLLHFSDQFAQRERQAQIEKDRAAQAEDQRQIALAKYEGDALDPKKFDPSLENDLNDSLKQLADAHKAKKTIPELMGMADQLSTNLAIKSKKIKEMQIGVAAQVAARKKIDPYIDESALTTGALKNAITDPKGFDATKNYVDDVINDLGPDLYHPQATGKAQQELLDKAKLVDVEEHPTYNSDGSLKTPGFKGKLDPALVKVNTNPDGSVKYTNGKASYDVQSENYRLPGTDHDYTDDNGQPVKVVTDAVFEKIYKNNPAAIAPIEAKVRKILQTPVKTPQGDVNMSPNSDYANMLRKKLTYDWLSEKLKDKFPLNPQEDKSLQYTDAKKRLQLAEQNHSLSQQRLWYQQSKESGKAVTIDDIIPLTEQIEKRAGVDITGKDGKPVRVVYARDIGAKEGEIIIGKHKDENGEMVPDVTPYKTNTGKPYYEVKLNGDWEGEGGKVIPVNQVKNEQLKYLSKDDLPASSYVKPVAPKKEHPIVTGAKKVAAAIKNVVTPKGKPKPSGLAGIEEGGLN